MGLDPRWDAVEQELGSFLPADYKAFIDHYGSGLVCGMIAVWNLRDKTCFPAPVKEYLLGESSVIASFKQSTVTPAESWFPEPDGLLPFCTVIDVHHVMCGGPRASPTDDAASSGFPMEMSLLILKGTRFLTSC